MSETAKKKRVRKERLPEQGRLARMRSEAKRKAERAWWARRRNGPLEEYDASAKSRWRWWLPLLPRGAEIFSSREESENTEPPRIQKEAVGDEAMKREWQRRRLGCGAADK